MWQKFVNSTLFYNLRSTISVILKFCPHIAPIPHVPSMTTLDYIPGWQKTSWQSYMNSAIAHLSNTFRLLIFFLRSQVPPRCWDLVVPAAGGGGVLTMDSWVSLWLSCHISSQYTPTTIWCTGPKIGLYQAYVLHLILVSTLQQHGCVICSVSTRHVVNVKQSIGSPHWGLVSCSTPEWHVFG